MNQQLLLIPLTLISLIVISVDGFRFFHHGRVHGGNLQLHIDPELREAPKNFTRWFNQSLDHFDVGNLAIWQQRYYVNDEFFDQENRNVAFLMIGGEGEATDVWMTNGAWVDYANQSKALMFQLEHRFYGQSHPTEDLSVENLKYLTSEQALADLATFVDAMNDEYKLSSEVKWIAFGGSYPGSLAAWARLKYPHLIHGSVSTSGPLLAIPDFQDYYQVVSDDLRNIDEDCYTAVKVGTAQIDLLLQHKVGQRTLTSLFELCNPLEESIDNDDDISNFYESLAGNFAGIAQYNKDNRLSTQGTLLGNITLDTVCNIMANISIGKEVARLAAFNSLMLKASNQSCFDFKYNSMIEGMKNVSWEASASEGGRQWTFQTCNEFGFYQTSDKKPQIFGNKFPLEFSIKQCVDLFGSKFDSEYLDYATRRTNTMYGAYDIEVSNVVFVHGSVDPWHALGITSTLNQNAPAIFIKGTAHCANMYPPTEDDLPQLKAARVQIGQLIQSWLDL
ncbi:putative serine protease K12H4.7 [Anthonomus grandis grandis]|uniref:putative serine protease K12H4.7 n=1 Tax=Anthonomus grandis grandis TaxID=2921223 RepID=UPI0021661C70|nr:putative serine protease K12H4.7 [Anthonomus grandis grandis]